MLVGHDEAGGELILQDFQVYKSFYGMASEKAMIKVFFGRNMYNDLKISITKGNLFLQF